MSGLIGSLGKDLYVRQTRDGRTIISAKPDFSKRQFSEGQLNHLSPDETRIGFKKLTPLFVAPADGSGMPEVFLSNAYSPAIVHN